MVSSPGMMPGMVPGAECPTMRTRLYYVVIYGLVVALHLEQMELHGPGRVVLRGSYFAVSLSGRHHVSRTQPAARGKGGESREADGARRVPILHGSAWKRVDL